MPNPSILASGSAKRSDSVAATSWTMTISIPAGSDRLLVVAYNGNRDYGQLATANLRTLKLGTTDLVEAPGADSGTTLTVSRSKFYYLKNPESAGSTTITVTNDVNHNTGGWTWQVWQDVDLAAAVEGVGDFVVSATTRALPPISSAAGDSIVIASMGYSGTTATAGGGTTITSNGVTVRQGLPGAAAMGYSAHPTVPALTGWVTDQIAVAGLLVKAVVAGPTGPTINTQPSNQSVAAGAAATFTVSATASAGSLTYQWQRSTDSGSTWANVSTGTGGTTAGYTTAATTISGGSANNGDRYRVNVTDSNGTATSTAATLTVSASAGSITSSPLKNNTGTLHLSAPFEAFVLDATTGGLVVRKTGLTSHASTGVVTFTDAAIVAATAYRVVWRQTTTGAQGVEVLTAA